MIDLDYIKERVKEQDLISITREDSDPSAIQEDRVLTAIKDAKHVVFERWSEKYNFPWSFAGNAKGTYAEERLDRIHFDIAIYFIYSLKYDDEEMKHIKSRYDKAIATLDEFSDKRNFPGIVLSDEYKQGISLDSFITNKEEEDQKLHGIFEINSGYQE